MANTLAYYNTTTIMAIKSFEILDSPLREGKIRLEKDFFVSVKHSSLFRFVTKKFFYHRRQVNKPKYWLDWPEYPQRNLPSKDGINGINHSSCLLTLWIKKAKVFVPCRSIQLRLL